MKETTTVKKINDSKREIDIVVTANDVQDEFDKAVKHYAQRVKIKGFRPGKAPSHIVKQMYQAEIKEAVINSLAPDILNKELKDHNLNPLGSPVISQLSFEEGKPLQFTAQFEVWPDFELPEYKKVPVKKKKVTVTDKEIAQSLEDLQKKSTQYIPVENRGVKDEDYVVVEIKGKDIQANKLLPTEKVVILVGHPDNEKALNDNILGLKPEDMTAFNVQYEKDHTNKKLAGKNIGYDVKVVSIKEKSLPEIDDDFAKDLGEFNDLKDLKAELKTQIRAAKENDAKGKMADEIIQIVSGRVTFDLPESIVESERLAILRQILSAQASQGMTKEEADKLNDEARQKAEQNIKNHIILKMIAEREQITVNTEDLEEELEFIAKNNNIPLAQLKARIEKEGQKGDIEDRLLLKKTVDFLLKNAIMN
jgi:trigger factor